MIILVMIIGLAITVSCLWPIAFPAFMKCMAIHEIYNLADRSQNTRNLAADKLIGHPGYIFWLQSCHISRIVRPLIANLHDKNIEIRVASAYILGISGDSRAVIPLIMAFSDPDSDVRYYAIHNVWKCGDHRAVKPLCEKLYSDNDILEISDILYSLGNLRDSYATMPILHIMPKLKKFGDREFEGRIEAIRALAEIGDKRAVQVLIHELNSKLDYCADEAVQSLGELEDPRAVPFLIKVLKHPNSVYNIDPDKLQKVLIEHFYNDPRVEAALIELAKSEKNSLSGNLATEGLQQLHTVRAQKNKLKGYNRVIGDG